ncbi:hypothetical protein BT93_F1133 [Corymbia citriodora subsp. variegata]|nr:hypothetical protein BT93_F1133 [Corymbia citriodora subsp. variegata]
MLLTLVHIIFQEIIAHLNPNSRPPRPRRSGTRSPRTPASPPPPPRSLPITSSNLSPPTVIPILSSDILSCLPSQMEHSSASLWKHGSHPPPAASSSAVDGGEEVEAVSEAVAEEGLVGVGAGRLLGLEEWGGLPCVTGRSFRISTVRQLRLFRIAEDRRS